MTHELQPIYEGDYKEHANMAQAALDVTRGIQSDKEYRFACEFLVRVRDRIKQWSEKFDPRIKQAYDTHRSLIEFKKEILSPLVKAETEVLKPALVKWERIESERRQREQEEINRKLREEEEERRLKAAEELEKAGEKELADVVLSEPVQAPTVVLPNTTKQKGISYRDIYSAEVVDVKALCRAVADGKIEPTYVLPNMTALNSLARNLKEAMNHQWQNFGVRVKSDRVVSAGRR